MRLQPAPPEDGARPNELDWLARRYRGLVHQCRLEHLARQLHGGPLAIRHSSSGFCGDRWRIELDGGDELRLKLYDPQRAVLAALCGLQWRDGRGWIVHARTTSGDDVVVLAYAAEVRR